MVAAEMPINLSVFVFRDSVFVKSWQVAGGRGKVRKKAAGTRR